MNAIVPLNVTAIRVNDNDAKLIVSQFKGRTAVFENLPYLSDAVEASTGDTIYQSLQNKSSPVNPLGAGVHVHWELPDYFRRGVQKASASQPEGTGSVVFPHAPNRWLVMRYLNQWNVSDSTWGSAQIKGFVVESDYVNKSRWDSKRPGVSVPLPVTPLPEIPPFKYMGRMLDYESWNPATENPDDFLPSYKDGGGHSLYLTSIGFVGPGFAAYYPECSSIFGLWDNFSDLPVIATAIAKNTSLQFRVSYQVIGWLNEDTEDPLHGIAATVTEQYNRYLAQQDKLNLPIVQTPADFFISVARQIAPSWTFNQQDIPFALNQDKTIKSLTVPGRTLCAGIMQEVVWNMLQDPGSTYFLSNPDTPGKPNGTWSDIVEVAIGNSTAEALSALLKKDMDNGTNDPNLLKNYEYLLNALQTGLLRNLESEENKLILLDETLHTRAFSALNAGLLWTVEDKNKDTSKKQIVLPLDLAEKLALLNDAQKKYDQARAALDTMTRQLFMDWIRYVKMYVSGKNQAYLTSSDIQKFLDSPGDCELQVILQAAESTGLVSYLKDGTGRIVGIEAPPAGNTLAHSLYTRFNDFAKALVPFPDFQILSATAPTFRLPAEPVLTVEGDRIEPVRRNGTTGKIMVRVSNELLSTLSILYNNEAFNIQASQLVGVPSVTSVTPMQAEVQALLAEAFLVSLSFASICADALKAQGGPSNPAVEHYADFVASLQAAQGGASPLESNLTGGLFAAIHEDNYQPSANPKQSVQQPLKIDVNFTNPASTGWVSDATGWNAQAHPTGFPPSRMDPFLPIFMIWTARLRPLNWGSITPGQLNYTPDNLTRYFELNDDAVEYRYRMTVGQPAPFTANPPSTYSSAVVLSKKPVFSLTSQIDLYLDDYPNDPADADLIAIKEKYMKRRIMAQTMSGFNVQQILRDYIPQILVEDLPLGEQDQVTLDIQAATNTAGNWYSWAFNSTLPIAHRQPGDLNFGPLRAAFMQLMELTIIDVFGQVMTLSTAQLNPDKSMQTIASYNMQPREEDTVNSDWIYLAPRLLAPSRLWFHWLSAEHNNQVAALSTDFVEMNAHPATSPVCGWILPNHLDASLFFYKTSGEPIGSFGIEAGKLKYRTRAGNRANPRDLLQVDIGEKGEPKVNPHLAAYMWWMNDTGVADPKFLVDMMSAILKSDTFINPANYAQNPTLSILIGRPLAITRSVLSIETPGGTLPLSQADNQVESPFPQDVLNKRVVYSNRQQTSSASLGKVNMPVRLGDLVNMDDGLVGYLIESAGANPYGIFYSPAAPAAGGHGVVPPSPTTIELTLNAGPVMLTMLVDPRAGVHATTGVLPVEELTVPSDQYGEAMSTLAMTFFSNPILKSVKELVVPLPEESGYDWSWIDPSEPAPIPLTANQATEFAIFGYTPQTVLEGWLELTPTPDKPERS